MSTINPTDDRILIRLEERNRVTQGGIQLPDNSVNKHKPRPYRVVAVGPGKLTDSGARLPMPCKENDVVLVLPFTGDPLDDVEMGAMQDRDLRIVKAEDVKAVVR